MDLLYDAYMRLTLIIEPLLVVLLGCSCTGGLAREEFAACLPEDVKLEDVVSVAQSSVQANSAKKVTVRDILKLLKAHCKKDKLVDNAGREIRFYRLVGCWGNPPADSEEQLAHQKEELQQLKQKFTVVEIPCASPNPAQIH